MVQTREQMLSTINKKASKTEANLTALKDRQEMLEKSEPVMVDGVDIKHCIACQIGKINTETMDCSAYSKAGQIRWMRIGWCTLGSAGPNPPKEKNGNGKQRAGQQKQKKR